MVCLALSYVFWQSTRRKLLSNSVDEQRAPPDYNCVFSESSSQFKLNLSALRCCFISFLKLTKVACLYAFNTICSISAASSLVSFTSPCPIVNSLGKVASTILSKSARCSPDLNRKTRQIASKHCRPAKIEAASFVLSSWTVMSTIDGHLSGKSY